MEGNVKYILNAPISGTLVPIEDVPDPVFAEKMLGDGVAILPCDGSVIAPIDGQIVALPSTGHACGLTTPFGFDILIHVGIDTVEMEGRGFTAHAERGDAVRSGATLIEFDLSEIEMAGKSALSPVVISNASIRLLASGKVKKGEPLFEVETEPK